MSIEKYEAAFHFPILALRGIDTTGLSQEEIIGKAEAIYREDLYKLRRGIVQGAPGSFELLEARIIGQLKKIESCRMVAGREETSIIEEPLLYFKIPIPQTQD